MVNRKGAGYLIESIVSIMVLLIFVAGALNSISSPETNWLGFQNDVASSDATYVLKKTEHIDEFVERGETGSIRSVASAMVEDRFEVAGNVEGTPTGRYQIGVFVEDDSDGDGADQVEEWSLQSRDCGGELTQINSEEPIRRHEEGQDTLYFADADPNDNDQGTLDYDTVWVDNGSQCQFSRSEGPYRLGDFIRVNYADNKRHYQFEAVKGDSEAVFYESPLTVRLKDRFSEFRSAEVEMDRFNFSDGLRDYDLLIFKDRNNRNEINQEVDGSYPNREKLLRYAENGKVVFAMDISGIPASGNFLSMTGMEYVESSEMDITDEGESEQKIDFGTSELSQEFKRYYESLGRGAESPIAESETNSIVSGQRFYTRDSLVASDSKHVYNRNDLNVTVRPDDTTNQQTAPEGVPTTDCSDAYMKATKEFPEDSGTEPLTVFSTKLSGTTADCDDTYISISIDKDGDGEFTDPNEEEILEGEMTTVNGRRYSPKIYSHDDYDLVFNGEPRKEMFSHTESFEGQDAAGFGIAPGTSFPEKKKVDFLAAATYAMLEGKSFGPSEASTVSTTAAGRTESGITYSVSLRWLD